MITDKSVKLVKGWGINDADYVVKVKESYYQDGKRKFKAVWTCPFYQKWLSMLDRSFSEKYLVLKPSYTEVTTNLEWKYFSKFRGWMLQQPWEGNQLDKDILIKGNKEYGPDACAFVPIYVNMCVNATRRGDLPLGVTKVTKDPKMVNEHKKPYHSRITNGVGGSVSLGSFSTSLGAHKAWQEAKVMYLEDTINRYSKEACFNTKVAEALTSRVWNLRLDILNNQETITL